MKKIIGPKEKIEWCPHCHRTTLRLLVKKVWVGRPYKKYKELRVYYQCSCGNKCYTVFAKEPIDSFVF